MNIKYIISFLIIILISSNDVFPQDNLIKDDDFSNAVDAEEKRAKWGTEKFKLDLIKEMSSANVSLFVDEHLETISVPSRIYYKFENRCLHCCLAVLGYLKSGHWKATGPTLGTFR